MEEEVKTLFISGLPNDVKQREIYNLFHSYPGYESCQLKYTGRGYQIVAFAVFSSQAAALTAKEALNGHKIDQELGSTLKIDLARSNSRAKRPSSDERGPSSVEKRFKSSAGAYIDAGMVHSVYGDLHGYAPPPPPPPPPPSAFVGGYLLPDGMSGFLMGPGMPPPPAPGSNAPCSTLFVSNLGSSCTELELTQPLLRCTGFRKVKMQSRGGQPVAFAEFQDTVCSTEAMNQLQNMILPSSVHGGIKLEYAKSRMGQPGRERLQQQQGFA